MYVNEDLCSRCHGRRREDWGLFYSLSSKPFFTLPCSGLCRGSWSLWTVSPLFNLVACWIVVRIHVWNHQKIGMVRKLGRKRRVFSPAFSLLKHITFLRVAASLQDVPGNTPHSSQSLLTSKHFSFPCPSKPRGGHKLFSLFTLSVPCHPFFIVTSLE